MNWLKRLFSPRTKTAPSPQPTPPVHFVGDATYDANENILEGVEFVATLHVTTPYSVLIHHGDVFAGPPSKVPQYGDQSQGIWAPKTKSWKSLGIDLPELPPSQHATDIGPQHPETYLPFLLDFRRIFESDHKDEVKLGELHTLAAQTPEYSAFWKRLADTYEDFPRNLFYRSFLTLPGVGRKTARALYESGFRSVEQIQHAELSELQKVQGVGPGLAKKLAATIAQQDGK
ncbi:MAG: helix-hairpin-helix domain-containing protein [Gallionella sp.]|jgi:hypothetical protein|nr:helix-hairpin-helix domain-containing protein [Gallionella sp.]MCK9354792.1 helix-hairpin-helix domain-containing protein [Gallionella sp.]